MRRLVISLALAVVWCAGGRFAIGQTVEGMVTGTVADQSGAVVPKATVTLTNTGTGVSQVMTTNVDGIYRFPLVPPGTYALSVTASGFEKYVFQGIVVEASKAVPVNVTLEVGKSSTVVEVSGQQVLVQTATSDLAETVQRSTIINIPLLSRNVYDLTFLAPQVSQGMNFNAATAGTRESATQYMLNGADNNDNFSEGPTTSRPRWNP